MTIGIIGLGAMGLGIAQVFAMAGHPVRATDANPETRATAPARLSDTLSARVAKGSLTEDEKTAILQRLVVTERVEDIAPADLVIEAVVERLAVKQSVFSLLEQYLAPGAVLATNTSSLSVGAIAQGLHRPDRVVGLHFFNPAPVMRLVELIPHAGTATDAVTIARSLTESAGKTVIQCADRPGFIVNRCARPYYGEALAMLEEGRDPGEIDAAMMAAGYRLGPFALIDLIGADINLAATEGLAAAMGHHPRYHVFTALKRQVESGHIGRKSLKGFVFPDNPPPPPADAATIALRIEATLANEAAWLLSEGGTTAEGIDTALKLGLNFPRGPFEALARHGRGTVLQTLARLEENAPPHLKSRYLPAPGLAP
ncbi:3-hydroxybutyryl-CoA dehydrogenase [Tabrizicola sp. TH137]|uniref:3-hydroxyacyl-CoA dehydrogenase n=1 Tax=Tabrizicola sp. TH137 TaxID=2067452 RepID=UPI000C7CEC90|nr:3-hydroxyacyl-CoA dehydrogenase family protein [Tabrizicola sp. TH137]PLL11143.1 3-hydroxybutyryl-CoA dehydrogenase [Tabrizicola sp. TH137]